MPGKASAVKHSARVLKLELGLLSVTCREIDSPVSLGVFLRAKYEEWNQLVSMDINPLDYTDPNSFMDDYLCVSLVSKNPRIPTGIDRAKVALDKFMECEVLNRQTNDRLISYLYDGISPSEWLARVVNSTRYHISKILGQLRRRHLHFV
jgi:hypothetical protein